MEICIEDSWKEALAAEFTSAYFTRVRDIVGAAYQSKVVYPYPRDIFAAFNATPLPSVRVVIVGQDPYHAAAVMKNEIGQETVVPQAMGLAFSVREGVPVPPSLANIFKELARSDLANNTSTDLTRWARQGVLLLNSVLTVEAGKPGSHAHIEKDGGWERFTDAVIQKISSENVGVVFLFWGAYARSKKKLIDPEHVGKHLILEAPHPSPLSAHTGFFGCGHFTKTNEYLRAQGQKEVEW